MFIDFIEKYLIIKYYIEHCYSTQSINLLISTISHNLSLFDNIV